MQTHWFYTVWPFIGVGGAIVMVAILLLTDTFRGNTTVSRWCDSVWLGWLAVPLYWVHQFEEYSLPVLGFDYSIQEMICKNLGFPPYPDCPIRGARSGRQTLDETHSVLRAPSASTYVMLRQKAARVAGGGLLAVGGIRYNADASRIAQQRGYKLDNLPGSRDEAIAAFDVLAPLMQDRLLLGG